MLDLQARLAALTLHVTLLEDEVGIVQMAAAARHVAKRERGSHSFEFNMAGTTFTNPSQLLPLGS